MRQHNPFDNLLDKEKIAAALWECFEAGDREGVLEILSLYGDAIKRYARLAESLKQEANIDLGSFAEYAENIDICPYGYSHKPNAETIKAIHEPRIHAGSSFEDFLKEMGIYEEVKQAAEERLHMDDIKTRGKVSVEIKSTHQFSVEQEEDGRWWGQSDDFPGIFVQADTLDELKKNAVEALEDFEQRENKMEWAIVSVRSMLQELGFDLDIKRIDKKD